MGNRANKSYQERLNDKFENLQLIEALKDSHSQMHIDQQALIATDHEVQQFYSGASHDLRQPVYAMQLYTEMLRDDPGRLNELLPKISQSCDSINSMFNTLFAYQRIHADDMNTAAREINIASIFDNLSHHFTPIAEKKNLKLLFKPIPGSVIIAPLHLIRILSNLVTNAIRYTHVGQVMVIAKKTPHYINFEIWDTGIGINNTQKIQIFEAYYKVDNDETKTTEGFGLGLAIVKQLIERIEGANIQVRSKLGRGSIFKFRLPLRFYVQP